ncbi:MAG: hypothetical protein KME52_11880 [Desmonostoc geniculatum HA4340-LM1]|nr:hypothetical protein [Desmonostoc geniculatum HA4340-LM1]
MVKRWLKQLRRWARKLLFQPKRKRRLYPKILKRWDGRNCAVLRIERETSGEVATYRIVSIYGQFDYLITLDRLRELLWDLVGEFDGIPIRVPPMDYQINSPLTHRFAVFCIQRNGSIHPIGIWDVDLQGLGIRSSGLGEASPFRAVLGVALHTLRIPHEPNKSSSLTWDNQVERVDWLGLLKERIRQELQNPNHNLKACIILRQT